MFFLQNRTKKHVYKQMGTEKHAMFYTWLSKVP